MRNLYRQNEVGLNIDAGRDAFPTLPGSNGSSIHLTSIDDGIFDNAMPSSFTGTQGLGGGVVAIAGLTTNAGATLSSNNALDLHFIGTRWSGNLQDTSRRDLQVYGALAVGGGLPGINDKARVLIRHGTSDGAPGAFQFIDSEPADPSHTNSVTIIGSKNAFIHTNVGIEPPPAELFSHDGSN